MNEEFEFGGLILRGVQDVEPIPSEPEGSAFTCTVELSDGSAFERVEYAARASDPAPTGQWVYAQCLAQWQNA